MCYVMYIHLNDKAEKKDKYYNTFLMGIVVVGGIDNEFKLTRVLSRFEKKNVTKDCVIFATFK